MSDSHRELLLKLKRIYARSAEAEEEARARIEAHFRDPEPNLVPKRAAVSGEAAVELFVRMARRAGTEVERIPEIGAAAGAIARYLRYHGVPQRIRAAPDPLLDRAGFERQPLMTVSRGTARPEDAVGVTVADFGIAETGTLLLASSPSRPTLLAFLPETCVVVLEQERVVGSYEAAWRGLLEHTGQPPRSINFITGPSRTGDIAQKITLGAHGPRRLLVLLIAGAEGR